ncbi:MAG: urate oxidase [Chloroflexi bacterium]|nr:urate oxidase [Chloroflexota bacterium]
MTLILGKNQFGKAEVRVVRVSRDGERHALADLNVSISLAGDFTNVHLTGDNANVLTTDAQKNTVYAFARDGVGEIEDFGLRLARHFVDTYSAVERARVHVQAFGWDRVQVDGAEHPHAFVRQGSECRTATVTCVDGQAWVVSGLTDLVVLKSGGSEFWGFLKDGYTTLPETTDRILATSVTARWRHSSPTADWAGSFAESRRVLIETFACKHSLSLQATLYAMGEAVLQAQPEIAEIRMAMPNKHHYVVDLTPFGRDNPNEVFRAEDRPYGLIEGSVLRDDAPEPGWAWSVSPFA